MPSRPPPDARSRQIADAAVAAFRDFAKQLEDVNCGEVPALLNEPLRDLVKQHWEVLEDETVRFDPHGTSGFADNFDLILDRISKRLEACDQLSPPDAPRLARVMITTLNEFSPAPEPPDLPADEPPDQPAGPSGQEGF